ncbi:MAG TPA: hypothetical protein VMT24_01640 [Aggregatilineaceae bacterium]|jgi:hypothetical protein|nr:hypothetical protein [Aggregatilineaceae bacterium]
MNDPLPAGKDAIRWYHHLLALPLRGLSATNVGPLGGENSISAVIEAILATQQGHSVDFPLSKTETFFVNTLTAPGHPPADPLVEYRALNHAAQREVLRRWINKPLGVIWLGGGVFTLDHPLIATCKPDDWHIWTDANPKVVQAAQQMFDKMHHRAAHNNIAHNIILPQDIDKLNNIIYFLADEGVEHIVIQAYGLFYVMTMKENFQWMSRLARPKGVEMSFIFNSLTKNVQLMPGVLAAFHHQRMVYYERSHIEALLREVVPGSEIVWSIPREQTQYGPETWLIYARAP